MKKQNKKFGIFESGYNSNGSFTEFRMWEKTYSSKDEACNEMHRILKGKGNYTSTELDQAVLYGTFYNVKELNF